MNTAISPMNTSVPTISVTPHTSATISITPVNKQYSVLEENLKQLHDIVEVVQHMKDVNVGALSVNSQILKIGEQCIRLSCSCPSLNELSSDADGVGNSVTSSPSHADLSVSFSTPYISVSSSGLHLKQNSVDWKSSGKIISSLNSGEILRRRSWAALEDLSTQRELDRKIGKQRSVSLSSLESDVEDIFFDNGSCSNLPSTVTTPTNRKSSVGRVVRSNRYSTTNGGTATGNVSTHSLNEADLQSDFNKIRLKREEEVRLLQARLPLQKSVSTPSILAIAARDPSSSYIISNERAITTTNNAVNKTTCYMLSAQRPSGTESETEEEMVSLLDDTRLRHFPYPDEVVTSTAFDGFLREKTCADGSASGNNYSYDDRREKRRKRGSLFFRKKKDKAKKSNGTHSWISVTHGNLSSVGLCDWCSKPVETKHALHCEGCLATVHQALCFEHISGTECPQKMKHSKVSGKNSGQQSQTSKTTNKKNSNVSSIASSSQGNSPIINEEKEDAYFIKNQHNEDHIISYNEEAPLVVLEFLDEGHISANDLDTEPFLGLQDEEPDTWAPSVSKDILKKLKEKEIKRQEHIYEFILTEKHHCLTLIVMQKIFVDGLRKYFNLGANLHRMFPRLAELTEIHLKFLRNLRKKQRDAVVVDSISDILLEQFSGSAAEQLKAVYGEFCSRHRDAVDIYKYYLQHDARFAEFVKYCQNNPLLKKKGIPECILFVTQRLTKYPLLIEPLIKTSKENKVEVDKLTGALTYIKDILTEVNSRVAEKEKEDRKLEIYNKIEAKSSTQYRGSIFKKSDILSNNRKLRFEGEAHLMQGPTKKQSVHVIVLSDILLFLNENNNKFSFFAPDQKPGVIGLQKLLVREKAGTDSKSIYLISSNPANPEMFELKIIRPKEQKVWIESIRKAVQNCVDDEQQMEDNRSCIPSEEMQRRAHISQLHVHQIVGNLRQKDVEQALIYEEKIALLLKLLAAAGVDIGMERPSYCHLVSEHIDNDTIRREVYNTIQKVNQLTSSLYISGTNLSRSASSVGERQSNAYVSPILPKRAETFGGFDNAAACKGFIAGVGRKFSQQFQKKVSNDVYHDSKTHSPSLPSSPVSTPELLSRKLAPNSTGNSNKSIADCGKNTITPPNITVSPLLQQDSRQLSASSSQQELPTLLQFDIEQQSAIVQLTSHIFTLASIIDQQMSSIDSLEAQLAFCRHELSHPSNEKDRRPIYKHNQQLEELRNLQDRLTHEKEQWQREKENEQRELEEKRKKLEEKEEKIKKDKIDIAQQRDQLYEKLQILSMNAQGVVMDANTPLLISPSAPLPPSGSPSNSTLLHNIPLPLQSLPVSSSTTTSMPSTTSPKDGTYKRRTDSVRRNQTPTSTSNLLPSNLFSATNEQKAAQQGNLQVKQKLPLKLAKLGSGSTVNGNNTSSTSASSTVTSPSISGGKSHQQILPWKLRESNPSTTNVIPSATEVRRVCGVSGYERLVSADAPSASSSASPSHSRTGSSPAMMQNIRVSSPSSTDNKDPAKAERTNTYPKIPEKYRISLGSSTSGTDTVSKTKPSSAEEEKVIFF
ncbi:rho guanine nucleotide exchange factor 18 isoform X2 [Planococcus citri]|uniref:rho guanine nucleotide exchange factor 18 isoform X2 n=1 Tax=Planococcus citri TaxID=170843 RepID=UPI0031F8F82F